MKVLVTGGAGFIGSHLCERLLNEDHEIICLDNFLTGSKENIKEFQDNKNFQLIEQDLTKTIPEDVRSKLSGVEAIFHLASPASPNHHSKISYHTLPMPTMMVNTRGTLSLLKLASQNKAKFLFASTSEVYGNPLEHPQKESYNGNVSTTGPRSVYDEAKRFGETLTAHFWRSEGVDARIARIFNTYGPRMLKEDMRMVVNFINQALTGAPLTVFGDGKQTRSLCYIDDMVEGLTKLMFQPGTAKQVVNLGSPDEHSVLEYAQIIKKLTGSKSEIIFSEKLPEDDPMQRRPDITKAKKLLNWQPKIDLEKGLSKLISYFKSTR